MESVRAHRPPGVRPAHVVLHSTRFVSNSAEAAVVLCSKGLWGGLPAAGCQVGTLQGGAQLEASACSMPACPWLQSGLIIARLKLMQKLLVVQGKRKSASSPMVTINAVRNTYTLASDVATLLERAANETIPAFRDDKPADSLAARHAQVKHTICTALRSDVNLPDCWLDQEALHADQTAGGQLLLSNGSYSPNVGCPDWYLQSRMLPDPARPKVLAQVGCPQLQAPHRGYTAAVQRVQEMDDYGRDFVERDEKRLTELGRRTVEMYVTAAIVTYLQVSCAAA